MGWIRWILGWLFLLLVVGGLGFVGYLYYDNNGDEPEYRTEKPSRGGLTVFLEATGTVQPEEVIDVGAQVAGKVEEFGKDPKEPSKRIDYGTKVEKGTILAVLDAELFRSRLRMSDAALLRAKADTRVLQAKMNQAEREWRRMQEVRGSRAITEQEIDAARSAVEISQAELARGKAVEGETEATRVEAETNLGYTIIRSPVNGVIIDRRVNIGQTVVASLNTPSLFLIATDLTKMRISVSVNEADIGQVHEKQTVTFTVDALPNDRFEGVVSQIRLNAKMEQNVVSYMVMVDANNSDMRLRPYLTANLKFLVNQRENALLVPNAALRFKPPAARVRADHRAAYEAPPVEKAKAPVADAKTPGAAGKGPPKQEKKAPVVGTVWTMDAEGDMTPVKVRIGITDGKRTEVIEVFEGGSLTPESDLVVGEVQNNKATSTVNPFAPPPIFGTKKQGNGTGGTKK